MAVFLYAVCFAAIFWSAFGLPFATRKVSVAVVFVVAALVLFYGGILMAGMANENYAAGEGARLSFLMVLALSVLPFAAGALARLVTLLVFKSAPNKPAYIAGVGAVTTGLFGVLGAVMFGLI